MECDFIMLRFACQLTISKAERKVSNATLRPQITTTIFKVFGTEGFEPLA
jgi:hypothetical protein